MFAVKEFGENASEPPVPTVTVWMVKLPVDVDVVVAADADADEALVAVFELPY